MEKHEGTERRAGIQFLLIFFGISICLVVFGVLYYQQMERSFRAEVEEQLASITDLKVNQLIQYRNERLGDASILLNNTSFAKLVRNVIDDPEDIEARDHVLEWLIHYAEAYQYTRVALLDENGAEIIASDNESHEVDCHILVDSVERVLSGNDVEFLDFHKHETDDGIHLGTITPIYADHDNITPLGVVLFQIDPETYLYPFISTWPNPSSTAETLLVRRDGDDVLFLNELKFQQDTALNLRISLDKVDVPAVAAVLGYEGIVDGVDYREVPVIADVRHIPDSPWYMVARMDKSEVFAPLREQLWSTVIILAILLGGMGMGLGMIYRQQLLKAYQDRLSAANELHESDQRFRATFEQSAVGLARVSLEGKWLQVNTKLCEILGYTREELLAMTFQEITPPDHHDADQENVEILLSGSAETISMTKRYYRKDRSMVWVNLTGSIVRNASGAPDYFIAVIEDITDRRLADEALRQSEEKYKALYNNISVGVAMISKDMKILSLNKQMQEWFPDIDDQQQPICYRAFNNPPREDICTYCKTCKTLEDGQTHEAITDTPTPDGIRNYRILSSAITDAESNVVAAIEMVEDITDKVQSEKALKEANERLQESIKRSKQLAVEAQAANIAKSQFLANMSHEIRTPMNGVIGMTGLLLETPLDNEQREYGEVIRKSGESLMRVISDILDFSKIEADKLVLEILDFDLRNVVEDTVDMLSVRAKEKSLSLNYSIDSALPHSLEGDPGRLRQVLLNIGDNAIKYTPVGEVSISVRVETEHEDTVEVRFEVKDQGIGIPEDKLEVLFDVFQQVDASHTREFGGTGLGLTISKQLVELMGGKIGVESTEGEGSVFWFNVPFAKSATEVTESIVEKSELTPYLEFSEACLNKTRILVVEDNVVNQIVIRRILDKFGFHSDSVANGQEALNSLALIPYDIVFMDLQMPVMNGFEAARKIRSGEVKLLNHDVKIIALTAHALMGDREKCLEAGMDGYIPKPIVPSDVAEELAKWLGETPSDDLYRKSSVKQPDIESEARIFDEEDLIDKLGDDVEFNRKTLSTFVSFASEDLAELMAGLEKGDIETVKFKAHTIKSSAGNVGAKAISKVAIDLESAANDGRVDEFYTLHEDLVEQFKLFKVEIENY